MRLSKYDRSLYSDLVCKYFVKVKVHVTTYLLWLTTYMGQFAWYLWEETICFSCVKWCVLNTTVLVLCVHGLLCSSITVCPSSVLCILCLYQELWGCYDSGSNESAARIAMASSETLAAAHSLQLGVCGGGPASETEPMYDSLYITCIHQTSGVWCIDLYRLEANCEELMIQNHKSCTPTDDYSSLERRIRSQICIVYLVLLGTFL